MKFCFHVLLTINISTQGGVGLNLSITCWSQTYMQDYEACACATDSPSHSTQRDFPRVNSTGHFCVYNNSKS